MEFFRTEWTTDEDRVVEGQAPHEIPLATCPVCRNYRGEPGVSYPWVDVRQIVDKETERKMRYMRTRKRGDPYADTWEEVQQIRAQLRVAIDQIYPLPPCATFGTFSGKLFTQPPVTDFVMPGACTLLVRRNVVARLNELGNKLQTFEIKLKQQADRHEDMVQVWAPPTARSESAAQVKWCQHCDRGSLGKFPIIDKSSVSSEMHFVMLKDAPDFLICSEKLIEDVEANKFSGLRYSPIRSE